MKYTGWSKREMIGELVLRGYKTFTPDEAKHLSKESLIALLLANDKGMWGEETWRVKC